MSNNNNNSSPRGGQVGASPRGGQVGAKYEYQTSDPMIYPLLKEFSKKNREHATLAESILWENIRRNTLGAEFKRQHIIYDYIADFVCLQKKLIIEVDGGYHAQYEQMVYDENRTKVLNRMGFKVIRFKNGEIISNISQVLTTIKQHL